MMFVAKRCARLIVVWVLSTACAESLANEMGTNKRDVASETCLEDETSLLHAQAKIRVHHAEETMEKIDESVDDIVNHSAANKAKEMTQAEKHAKEDAQMFVHSPFLMSHDAATGFIGYGGSYVRVQTLSFVDQLACGIRAFDLRTVAINCGKEDCDIKAEDLRFQHTGGPTGGIGWISDDQSVANTFHGENSIKAWANAHPSELVVMVLSHCSYCSGLTLLHLSANDSLRSSSCTYYNEPANFCDRQSMKDAIAETGIPYFTDCGKVNDWTLAEAKGNATLQDGPGMVMVISGNCVHDNYGVFSGVYPPNQVLGKVKDVMDGNTGDGPQKNWPYVVQAMTQQCGTCDVNPSLKNQGEIDAQIYRWLKDPKNTILHNVNFLMKNLACSYSTFLSEALGATISPKDRDQCNLACTASKSGACSDWNACGAQGGLPQNTKKTCYYHNGVGPCYMQTPCMRPKATHWGKQYPDGWDFAGNGMADCSDSNNTVTAPPCPNDIVPTYDGNICSCTSDYDCPSGAPYCFIPIAGSWKSTYCHN